MLFCVHTHSSEGPLCAQCHPLLVSPSQALSSPWSQEELQSLKFGQINKQKVSKMPWSLYVGPPWVPKMRRERSHPRREGGIWGSPSRPPGTTEFQLSKEHSGYASKDFLHRIISPTDKREPRATHSANLCSPGHNDGVGDRGGQADEWGNVDWSAGALWFNTVFGWWQVALKTKRFQLSEKRIQQFFLPPNTPGAGFMFNSKREGSDNKIPSILQALSPDGNPKSSPCSQKIKKNFAISPVSAKLTKNPELWTRGSKIQSLSTSPVNITKYVILKRGF